MKPSTRVHEPTVTDRSVLTRATLPWKALVCWAIIAALAVFVLVTAEKHGPASAENRNPDGVGKPSPVEWLLYPFDWVFWGQIIGARWPPESLSHRSWRGGGVPGIRSYLWSWPPARCCGGTRSTIGRSGWFTTRIFLGTFPGLAVVQHLSGHRAADFVRLRALCLASLLPGDAHLEGPSATQRPEGIRVAPPADLDRFADVCHRRHLGCRARDSADSCPVPHIQPCHRVRLDRCR